MRAGACAVADEEDVVAGDEHVASLDVALAGSAFACGGDGERFGLEFGREVKDRLHDDRFAVADGVCHPADEHFVVDAHGGVAREEEIVHRAEGIPILAEEFGQVVLGHFHAFDEEAGKVFCRAFQELFLQAAGGGFFADARLYPLNPFDDLGFDSIVLKDMAQQFFDLVGLGDFGEHA